MALFSSSSLLEGDKASSEVLRLTGYKAAILKTLVTALIKASRLPLQENSFKLPASGIARFDTLSFQHGGELPNFRSRIRTLRAN